MFIIACRMRLRLRVTVVFDARFDDLLEAHHTTDASTDYHIPHAAHPQTPLHTYVQQHGTVNTQLDWTRNILCIRAAQCILRQTRSCNARKRSNANVDTSNACKQCDTCAQTCMRSYRSSNTFDGKHECKHYQRHCAADIKHLRPSLRQQRKRYFGAGANPANSSRDIQFDCCKLRNTLKYIHFSVVVLLLFD